MQAVPVVHPIIVTQLRIAFRPGQCPGVLHSIPGPVQYSVHEDEREGEIHTLTNHTFLRYMWRLALGVNLAENWRPSFN